MCVVAADVGKVPFDERLILYRRNVRVMCDEDRVRLLEGGREFRVVEVRLCMVLVSTDSLKSECAFASPTPSPLSSAPAPIWMRGTVGVKVAVGLTMHYNSHPCPFSQEVLSRYIFIGW